MSDAPADRAPLRILIGCDTYAPDVNGSVTFVRRLTRGLIQRGHEVHVMAPAVSTKQVGTFVEHHEGVDVTVHRIYSWKWLNHWLRFMLPWRAASNSERVLAQFRPDAIHYQSHIVVGRGLTIAGKRHGIRLVGTNHTMPENILQHVAVLPKFALPWLAAAQWRSAGKWFGKADAVTTPTRSAAEFFERNTGLEGVLAVSNGIECSLYTPDFGPRDHPIVTFVGRLDEEKKIEELIEAVALIDPELGVEAVIIGEGEMRPKLEQRAAQLGVSDRVHFAGFASDDELRSWLTKSTVFAMPSRAELESIATMEAMASGLPTVAANAMALPHLVHPGENGYLYEPGNIEEFADHLTAIITAPPHELDRLRHNALKTAMEHDLSRTLDTFEALYRGEPVPGAVEIPSTPSAKEAR